MGCDSIGLASLAVGLRQREALEDQPHGSPNRFVRVVGREGFEDLGVHGLEADAPTVQILAHRLP